MSGNYLDESFQGVNLKRKIKHRKSENEELDEILVEWLFNCRSKKLSISGMILQKSALEIAEKLKIPDFKPSNGG